MSDYIERKKILDFCNAVINRQGSEEEMNVVVESFKAFAEYVKALPSAQQDAVTVSLEELINDYGEDGYFIVDGTNYQANELLNELKINSSVGEKFRKKIAKTIVQYFMKFGG